MATTFQPTLSMPLGQSIATLRFVRRSLLSLLGKNNSAYARSAADSVAANWRCDLWKQ